MSPLVLQQDSSCDLLFGKDEEGLSDEEWLSSSCCDQGLPCCDQGLSDEEGLADEEWLSSCCDQGLPCCDQEGLSCCDQEWLGCCDQRLSVEEGLSDEEGLSCCDQGLSVEEGLSLLPGWVFEKVCLASANNVQATRWV